MCAHAGAIDQQGLGCAANAGAAHLGVEHDAPSHRELGVAVDIDVTVALEMTDDRHTSLRLYARHQTLTPSRHQHVDKLAHSCEHLAYRRAIAGGYELHGRR